MNSFDIVKEKLRRFVIKYHCNELVKGLLLFVAICLLYLLITVIVESSLWLGLSGRRILFMLFVGLSAVLFVRFVIFPLLRIFRLKKGIDIKKATELIGNYFPEVSDKLLNLIQLGNVNDHTSALLMASIEQKSEALKPFRFDLAVDYRNNLKHAKWLAIPIGVVVIFWSFGQLNFLKEGYTRVVNYNTAYEPPAPFIFFIVNNSLKGNENEQFVLKVKVEGDYIPNDVVINFDDQGYFMRRSESDGFEYVFQDLKDNVEFSLQSGEVTSKDFLLSVIKVPTILETGMTIVYPGYLNKKTEKVKGTGNTVVPEGSRIQWNIKSRNTSEVYIIDKDTTISLEGDEQVFSYSRIMKQNWEYVVSAANKDLKDYDRLSFGIEVVKDQYPEIVIDKKVDTLTGNIQAAWGRLSDDYGLSKLQLVYYNLEDSTSRKSVEINIGNSLFEEFLYDFPGELDIMQGINYEFYFEVFDNDGFNGAKSTKSETFTYRLLTDEERRNALFKENKEAIKGFNKTMQKLKDIDKEFDQLNSLQKEKKSLDFNDKKRLEEFIKKQKREQETIKNISKELEKNLENIKSNREEPFKDALKERLERNRQKMEKNAKLLEELKELMKEINKEQLSSKMEDLKKQNKNNQKNLEQLLELTKRFYVKQKYEKIAEDLKDLGKKQEELSEEGEDKNIPEAQQDLNEKFDELKKELEDLKKENKELKKPMDLKNSEDKNKEIKEDQNKAKNALEENKPSEAKKNQKKAAKKMQQMASGMMSQMQMSGSQQNMEDMEMLRQVLDNLVDFSLEQEELMNGFKGIDVDNPTYSNRLRKQSVLKENFIHIDDSLYALALRNPKITEGVLDKLTEVEFNIDNSLDRLAQNRLMQGTASQQYTVTNANDLSVVLSNTLSQMQNAMSSPGKGNSGEGEFQLQDIIKKQEELNEQMQKGSNKGKSKTKGEKPGDSKEGKEGKEGEQGKQEGAKGKDGSKGKKGNEGSGEGGDSPQPGENEDDDGMLYEIFKQQQKLRQDLEDRISKEGIGGKEGSRVLKEMENAEKEILLNGFNESTLSRMINLKHQLMKLKEATLEQGEKEEREGETNSKDFTGIKGFSKDQRSQYLNNTEILNKQALPLQDNFKKKVKKYFQKDD